MPKKVSPEKASNADAAMDYVARLLISRERSVHEVRSRLAEKGYEAAVVSEAVGRAQSCGLLDDQRFAQSYLKDKIRLGWGKRRIEQELYRFGIKIEDIDGYPEAFFTEESQVESALRALSRHHSRSKNPRQAAYRYLMGKGYSPSIVSAAIKLHEDAEG